MSEGASEEVSEIVIEGEIPAETKCASEAETSILDHWDIDVDYFTAVVRDNPSLRGMILGYIAERKLRDLLISLGGTEGHRKDDDHDRSKKGDLTLNFKGEEIVIEVKSLQSNTISIELVDGRVLPLVDKREVGRKPSPGFTKSGKPKLGGILYKYQENCEVLLLTEEQRQEAKYRGSFQCDASDKREITLKNGEKVTTTLLQIGEFDVIAAGIFSFRNKWEFAFALNEDLPRSTTYGENSSQLISSLVGITLPLEAPFTSDPIEVFEKVIQKRRTNS